MPETASPVQVISKQDIDQAGKGTVAEYLQTLTLTARARSRSPTGAASRERLLRASRCAASASTPRSCSSTVAGSRRQCSPTNAQRSYTDLNQIPLEAVETDRSGEGRRFRDLRLRCVAGVINIILKKKLHRHGRQAQLRRVREGRRQRAPAALTHGFRRHGQGRLQRPPQRRASARKDAIFYRDRVGRGSVGVSAIGQPAVGLRSECRPSNNIGRNGGQGTIPVTTAPRAA